MTVVYLTAVEPSVNKAVIICCPRIKFPHYMRQALVWHDSTDLRHWPTRSI